MAEKMKLTLTSERHTVELELFEDVGFDAIDEASQLADELPEDPTHMIYNDIGYSFSVEGLGFTKAEVMLNRVKCKTSVDEVDAGGTVRLTVINESSKDFQFRDCWPNVIIRLKADGVTYRTESVIVLMKDSPANKKLTERLRSMVGYIYTNCDKYLTGDEHEVSGDVSGDPSIDTPDREKRDLSLKARINLFNKLYDAYRSSYVYFKNNPYSKMRRAEKVDSFERLNAVTPRVVQHIVCHPAELIPVGYNSGIRSGNRYYQPMNVLTEYNERTLDTEENHMLMDTLFTVLNDLGELIDELDGLERRVKRDVPDGYTNALEDIFSDAVGRQSELRAELADLREKYRDLYFAYYKLFRLDGRLLKNVPRFTLVIRAISAYHTVYFYINEYMTGRKPELTGDRLIMSCLTTDRIYEYYVLVKLLDYLGKSGELTERSAERYFDSGLKSRYYTEPEFNNVFRFATKDNASEIAVYYQIPVRTSGAPNRVKLVKSSGFFSKSSYLTPDYIVEFRTRNAANGCDHRYLILDAKYRSVETMCSDDKKSLRDMMIKYLLCISPKEADVGLCGLVLVCGKLDGIKATEYSVTDDNAVMYVNDLSIPAYFTDLVTMSGASETDAVPEHIFGRLLQEEKHRSLLPGKNHLQKA